MRCKHENADHLMPGDMWLDHPDDIPYVAICEQFRCIDCGAWLSLGRSNDKPKAVKIEIRAAGFIACHFADNRDCKCYDCGWLLPPDAELAARELELIIRELPYEVVS